MYYECGVGCGRWSAFLQTNIFRFIPIQIDNLLYIILFSLPTDIRAANGHQIYQIRREQPQASPHLRHRKHDQSQERTHSQFLQIHQKDRRRNLRRSLPSNP